MTFKPTIVGEEELELPPSVCSPDGELNLPEDLASLASQLSSDSARLAALYPPGPRGGVGVSLPVREKSPSRRPAGAGGASENARFFGPALAVLLAVTGLGAAIWSWSGGSESRSAWTAAHRGAPAEYRIGPAPSASQGAGASAKAGSSATEETAAFVQELSGPELEGFLDLLEQQDAAASRLSI
jgi:hypothetical protein